MKRLIRTILQPWPLRPGWMLVLLATVQNFGISDARLSINAGSDFTELNASIVGLGLSRALLSLLLAAVMVGAEWVVWRLTASRSRPQPMWAYLLMIAAGALAAVGFRAAVQTVQGLDQFIPAPGATFLHYFVLIAVLQISIGVISTHVSDSTRRAEEALARLNEQERRFVASEERARRIAAEFLHNRVQADLLVIAIELRRVADDAPEELARRLLSITEAVETVRHSDVRDTSRSLSPLVQSTDLASALAALADRWAPAMRVSVTVAPSITVIDDGGFDDTDRALGIYRIIEQALLNAAAHGRATQAQASVTEQDRDGARWIRVHVTDDGVGFDPAQATTGGGFATSQVWARLLGGEWTVSSAPGQGATVTAWIPQP